MPFTTRYYFTVSMDVDPDKEALFNEVYDTEHAIQPMCPAIEIKSNCIFASSWAVSRARALRELEIDRDGHDDGDRNAV